jgi:hypothetical protein
MKSCALLSRGIPKKIISVDEAGYDWARMRVIPNGFDFLNLVAAPEQRIVFSPGLQFFRT